MLAVGQKFRSVRDSLGEVEVPEDALYGAQTQRAVENFRISGLTMPGGFICSLALVKAAAARANMVLGELEAPIGEAIYQAAMAIASGKYQEQFPVDVFQTGSGTSSNMNANEVIAHLASESSGQAVHPNDHVNRGQSSNDVIPTTVHVSSTLALQSSLLPALKHIQSVIERREQSLDGIIKTGRTHLMDAMPLSLAQELSAWRAQLNLSEQRLGDTRQRLCQLAQGGTAVGTGVNAVHGFSAVFSDTLSELCGVAFAPADNSFAAMSSQDTAVELSGQLKTLAVALAKIANDLRWMNSGPLSGLGEITLKALQPGSSIMPGKVNPVIPEAVAMAAAQVMGNDTTITVAGQSGNFQLNVMLPLIAHNLLQSIELLTNSCRALADQALADFEVNIEVLQKNLGRNPVLVTALNRDVGYAKAAEIAHLAQKQGRSIIDVARELTDLNDATLERLLDPNKLI